MSQPGITFPFWGAAQQTLSTLNYDAALTTHLVPSPSVWTEQITNALDAQTPTESHTTHLAALRDARNTVFHEIEETEHQLTGTGYLHGSTDLDWLKANAHILNADDSAWLISDWFELVAVDGIPVNTRALRLLKKLEWLRNWSRLIDHAISVIVRCSKRQRHAASQFLSNIRWHLVHGCHPPDPSKSAVTLQLFCLGCVA